MTELAKASLAKGSCSPKPLTRLAQKGTRIVATQDFLAVHPWMRREEIAKCPPPPRRIRRKRERDARAAQPRDQMINVAPPPATSHTNGVRQDRRHRLTTGRGEQHCGKIHTSVHCELQRAPEPPVHLHEIWGSGTCVQLVLDHGHTAPAKTVEQRTRLPHEVGVRRDAFPIDTDAARRRLLADATVRELRERLSVPHEQEDAYARAHNATLCQQRIGIIAQIPRGREQLRRVRHMPYRELGATPVRLSHRARRIEHQRICRGSRGTEREQPGATLNDILLRDGNADLWCSREQRGLVADTAEHGVRREW